MKSLYLFPLCLICLIAACEKHPGAPEQSYSTERTGLNSLQPVVFQAALADTLPAGAVASLGLDHVTGIEVKYLSGKQAHYFQYTADRESLLDTIARLPFSKHGIISDTRCRQLTIDIRASMKPQISQTEYSNSTSFWDADPDEYELYECIKSPHRHTILIAKHSNRVLHRIDNAG